MFHLKDVEVALKVPNNSFHVITPKLLTVWYS